MVRVDGIPNVLACRARVRGGETVETQNVLGSREVDLLSATDFLFPHGMDHHRLLAGVPGASAVVQRLARRIAGLGRLPDSAVEIRAAERRDVDVLVIGGGGAGLSAALELGPRALLVDDAFTPGGALALLEPERAAALTDAARRAGAALRSETTALGIYREPDDGSGRMSVLLAGPRGVSFARVELVILASGAHEVPGDFPGNDLPGLFSARAGLALLAAGIAPDRRTAIVGEGAFAARARALLGATAVHVPDITSVIAAEGRLRVRALQIREGSRAVRQRAGAALVDAGETPAFELAVQAGATLTFDAAHGYRPVLDEHARAAPGLFCAGRVSGLGADGEADGRRVAQHVRRLLSAR